MPAVADDDFRLTITALADRLAEIPTPAGPTPKELGTSAAFIPLTSVLETLPSAKHGGDQ